MRCAAFDKSDLMYLRDEEERQRFTEDERRDRELQQFQKQRARLEPAAPGPPPPRPVRRDKDKGSTRCSPAPEHGQGRMLPRIALVRGVMQSFVHLPGGTLRLAVACLGGINALALDRFCARRPAPRDISTS